jgi:hypothetical protein
VLATDLDRHDVAAFCAIAATHSGVNGRRLYSRRFPDAALLEARPDGYSELGRHQVCGKSWSHPAFANGRLYLRDRRELYAFDLAPDPAP